jgi:hypothetical protein
VALQLLGAAQEISGLTLGGHMLLIRNVFRCKPGKATALVKMFKETTSKSQASGTMPNARVMTDITSNFWTVVFEIEVESLDA